MGEVSSCLVWINLLHSKTLELSWLFFFLDKTLSFSFSNLHSYKLLLRKTKGYSLAPHSWEARVCVCVCVYAGIKNRPKVSLHYLIILIFSSPWQNLLTNNYPDASRLLSSMCVHFCFHKQMEKESMLFVPKSDHASCKCYCKWHS